ncbi:hypothetical protein MLD38_014096 [Melastoma candidum]|uniref:Uncharacterized protein n=1 Tax=Melastoma candidum TaxID=119954 RepID=A0ACB9RBM3_9MYRT|nr:hypothetical protein MLD38_014096 [Melastoma candidum]
MEFRSGNKVEVWCKKQVAWRLAEIISSDRNYLFIRYDCQPGTRDIAAPVKVSKKIARPLSPVAAFTESFGVGDVVEVRALYSWNAAIILRVISEWFCLVKLLGSGEEVNVTRTNIRAHQAWEQHDGTTRGKVYSPELFGKSKNLCSLRGKLISEAMPAESRSNMKRKDDVEAVIQDARLECFPLVIHGRLKRLSSSLLSNIEASSGYPHKRMATNKNNVSQKLEAGHQFCILRKGFLEKVDNVAYKKDVFGERHSHAYPGNRLSSSLETEREDPLGCRINGDHDGYDTNASSVGSCSIIGPLLEASFFLLPKVPKSDARFCLS